MFKFIFGLFWTLFTFLLTWGFYFTGMDITVNGERVSQEEFNSMILPKVFIGLFLIIGIAFMFFGLKKIIRDIMTSKRGIECLGKIVDVYPSGTYINERPQLKADFAVYLESENRVDVFSEIVGMDWYNFPKGSWFKLKYYEGDINVGEKIKNEEVPINIVDMVDNAYNLDSGNVIGEDDSPLDFINSMHNHNWGDVINGNASSVKRVKNVYKHTVTNIDGVKEEVIEINGKKYKKMD